MLRLRVPYVEFYITNVCNLACPGCNRFNNYEFRGYQRWQDYADIYQQWAQEIEPSTLGILGGEPLLTPDAMAWIQGVSALWPGKFCKVVTNGFYLNRVRGLYDFLAAHPNVEIWLGIHNKTHKPRIMREIETFLVGPLQHEFNDTNRYQQSLVITDSAGVRIKVEYNWWFHQGALIRGPDGFRLHESDPERAHANCHMRTCHHFIRGKLYKCGVVALLPEFAQQFPMLLDPDDRALMQAYRPLSLEDDFDTKSAFVTGLDDPIAQCRFCPEVYHGDQIFALEKRELKS